jgi:Sigma 54 modulation protein / S30EA ribosomal protein
MNRVEVTFRNLKSSEWLDREIRARAGKLENYCKDIVACRVLVGIPHRHREHGNRFEVHIDVVVPGEEIAVSHSPSIRTTTGDGEGTVGKRTEILGMRKDVLLAVRDAFAAAKRQVQDYARRRRLAVKAHTAKVTVVRT